MSPEELAGLFRSDVDDTDTADPLWSDDEVYSYMDRAQKQFCREVDYFADASTVEIVQVPVTAANAFVDLDPRITKIRGARLASTGRRLEPKQYDQIEQSIYARDAYTPDWLPQVENWETATGNPTLIITDLEKDKGRLVPIPVANDTINLHVYRLPLDDILPETAEFEITENEYISGLMFWMKYLAYQKNDADVYNRELASDARDDWDDFITRTRGYFRRKRFGSTRGTVVYGGL